MTNEQAKKLKEYGKTVCANVVLKDNGEMKRARDLKDFDERLQVVAVYRFMENEIIKI